MFENVEDLVEKALSKGLNKIEAMKIANWNPENLALLFAGSDSIRQRFFENSISLCSIINAKSGRCKENCAFCSQSSHHQTKIELYEMLDRDTVQKAAKHAKSNHSSRFSIVTSGKALQGKGFEIALDLILGISEIPELSPCASIGIMGPKELKKLKKAGLKRYHHNLETSRSHYKKICTTRNFEENLNTVRAAKEAGLEVCSGGIFGMGETWEQRVELAFELKELDVDSVPINFLHPIPGTPLEGYNELTPMNCLKIITLFRFIMPSTPIILCGGRIKNLGFAQSLAFMAGASGLMIGNYLTTKGPASEADLKMIHDLGMSPSVTDVIRESTN